MSFWNNIFGAITPVLEETPTLEAGIQNLIYGHSYKSYSQSIEDSSFFIGKRWLEVRDDLDFQEAILHLFKEDGKYLRILDGDVIPGTWEKDVKGFFIKIGREYEFYEPVFLDDNYFIMRKHGNIIPKGIRPYFMIVIERRAKGREWPELLNMLFEDYQDGRSTPFGLIIMFVIMLGILLYSIL